METPKSQTEEQADPAEIALETIAYANNTFLEPSVWDLKLIFGQLEQHTGKPIVDWHTAVTLPWIQAKILSYYLQIHLAAYEGDHSKINIPESVRPPKPVPPTSDDPTQDKVFDSLNQLHALCFGK